MNHIYLGISLVFLCLVLAYVLLSTLILVTVFCVVLAVLYFKDDLSVFRYIASHVAYLYLWICELCSNIQIMYHQSNSANFPARKCIENNGTVANKFDRLHHRLKSNVHNLNSSYSLSSQPLSSSTWNSTSNITSHSNQSYQSLQEISKLSINPVYSRDGGLSPMRSVDISPTRSQPTSPSVQSRNASVREYSITIPSSRSKPMANKITQDDSQMRLDARLFANVCSPGFCGRVAEGLAEIATHQSKYDHAGAFPVVNFKSQSPKIKIKTPVRVRLAPPPSNDILYSSIASSPIQRSPVVGTDESMKSVLQVLKEISRKRIHSHVEDDCDENTKRLRISESQYNPESMLQTSLLQQTIQGKRAREESSPNEEDVKKRRKPSFNNEYLSSLSSSMSIKAPHLESKKRKAQAVEDSSALTPVLGKLLKVQTEVTPPPLILPPTLPPRELTPPCPPMQEPKPPKIPSPMGAVEQTKRVEPSPIMKPTERKSSELELSESCKVSKDESTTSRLLGRLSSHAAPTPKLDIPAPAHNMFMTTNDLSLSPPKENRLAAMIAVLGGPSEVNDRENVTSAENKVVGKALFTSPETPETPKQNKKVTFNDSLTTTKIYDRDKSGIGSSSSSDTSLLPQSTSNPLESSLFNLSKSPVSSTQDTKSNFDSGSPLQFKSSVSNLKEESKALSDLSASNSVVSSLGSQQTSSPLMSSSATSSTTSSFVTKSIATSQISAPSTQPTFSFGAGNSTLKQPLPSETTDAAKAFSFGNSDSALSGSSTTTFSPIQTNSSQINEAPKTSALNLFTNKESPANSFKVQNEAKPLVNGFATSTSQFTFNSATPQTSANKPSLPAFDLSTSKSSQSSFNFTTSNNMFSKSTNSSMTGANPTTQVTPNSSTVTSAKLPETKPVTSAVSGNQTNPPGSNMFGKSSPFNFGAPSQSQPSLFGTQSSENAKPSSRNSIFGNNSQQPSAFAITSTQSNSNNTAPSTTPTSNLFVNVATSNSKPISFTGSGNSLTPQSNPVFGTSNTPASNKNSPFAMSSNSSNTSQKGVFGTQTNSTSAPSIFGNVMATSDSKPGVFSTFSATTQPSSHFNNSSSSTQTSNPLFSKLSNTTPKFGEGNNTTPVFGAATTANSLFSSQNTASPSFGSQNTTPVFGSQNSSATAFGSHYTGTPGFGSQSTVTPAFGSQNNATPTFGSQNTAPPAFGSQNSAPPAFGTQRSAPPAFGSQNTSGTFNLVTSSSGAETKSAFASTSSPFMFGSSAASNQPSKPIGAAAPFSFGSSQPTLTQASSTQPSIPAFSAPSPAFGSNLQPPSAPNPAFGSNLQPPSAPNPAFGSNLQPPSFAASVQQPTPAPIFAFGQSSSAPSTGGFQFNATAPQPVQGGMFNIGSGSTAPRSKTGALRRRPK